MILADPQGSGLYNKVRRNVFFSPQEAEGKRSRHQVDTVVEGVGIHRMTGNLEAILGKGKNVLDFHRALNYSHDDPLQLSALAELCWVDDAIRVSDREAAIMSRYLVRHEGLFVGSSSCVNLVAVVKLVRRWRASGLDTSGKVVVTMLCDAGYRHLTKFWSDSYLLENGILSHQDDLQKLTGDLTFIL